ncbi:MAG: hypothetical protein DCC55_07510 [Chloroflexi bacterium]|nr:MAG: hypothetical protein DCC55_07510 [Chloroflexota bacterium]
MVEMIDPNLLAKLPDFRRRIEWFLRHRPNVVGGMATSYMPGADRNCLAAILTKERLVSVLHYMLDEHEFLSDYGIRSLSKCHEANPYRIDVDGQTFEVSYWPAKSRSSLFGGNSNWRGPVWFPINYLLPAHRRFAALSPILWR